MRTIQAMPLPRRRAVARETLEIYAPIAERLGLYNMKLELEDLGFEALYPHRYQVLERALRKARGNQKEFLKKIDQQLTGALAKNEIHARVETREKHLYSIYKKMLRKRASLAEIVDVYGLRIIADKPDTCYRALGVVHCGVQAHARALQGLHRHPAGQRLPVAAHDAVRPQRRAHRGADPHRGHAPRRGVRHRGPLEVQERRRCGLHRSSSGHASGCRAWSSCRRMAARRNSSRASRSTCFPTRCTSSRRKGTILRLPSGATVVDFAYAVHTDIGNRCVAAKVDRRLTPLRTVLRNGQTVEIITAKGAMPNPSWVNFVVTAKARNAIRHYLKSLRRTEAIALGQRLLNQALGEFRLTLEEVSPEVLQAVLGEFGMKDLDDLYEKIGLGERLAPLVARRLLPAQPAQGGDPRAPAPLAIAGTEGLLVSYARCCFPLPNDPVFAFLSAGRGVIIHRERCVNVEDYRKHPEKWLPVSWRSAPERLFNSEIRIYVVNRTGVLAAVAAAIASTETNIHHVSIEEQEGDASILTFELKVRDRKHLARVMRVIRRMPDVTRVSRTIAAHARTDPADGRIAGVDESDDQDPNPDSE